MISENLAEPTHSFIYYETENKTCLLRYGVRISIRLRPSHGSGEVERS